MHRSPGSYSTVTVPKSGCPVRGQIDVNSVPVIVTDCTLGAGNASAFNTSRASRGFSGRGSGPVAGSFFDGVIAAECNWIGALGLSLRSLLRGLATSRVREDS